MCAGDITHAPGGTALFVCAPWSTNVLRNHTLDGDKDRSHKSHSMEGGQAHVCPAQGSLAAGRGRVSSQPLHMFPISVLGVLHPGHCVPGRGDEAHKPCCVHTVRVWRTSAWDACTQARQHVSHGGSGVCALKPLGSLHLPTEGQDPMWRGGKTRQGCALHRENSLTWAHKNLQSLRGGPHSGRAEPAAF